MLSGEKKQKILEELVKIFLSIMKGSIDLHDTREAYLTSSVMSGTD